MKDNINKRSAKLSNKELTPEERRQLIEKIEANARNIRAYDGPPRSNQTTALCRCGSISQMTGRSPSWVDDSHAVTVAKCATCHQSTLVIESGEWRSTGGGTRQFQPNSGVLWWPATGGSAPFDTDAPIPERVRHFWDEAIRCISVQALHGAAVMLRNCLAVIATDRGSSTVTAEKTLHGKLNKLSEERPEVAFLSDYMSAIKAIGNAGAHPEDWEPLDEDQVLVARDLVRLTVRTFYEEPARVRRSLPKRQSK